MLSDLIPDFQLIKAVKDNSVDGIMKAMENGASLEARDHDGKSVLEIAQARECREAGRKLMELGADINARINKLGDRLLHRCAKQGDLGFSVLLIEHGADTEARNGHGFRPIDYAREKGFEYLANEIKKANSWSR